MEGLSTPSRITITATERLLPWMFSIVVRDGCNITVASTRPASFAIIAQSLAANRNIAFITDFPICSLTESTQNVPCHLIRTIYLKGNPSISSDINNKRPVICGVLTKQELHITKTVLSCLPINSGECYTKMRTYTMQGWSITRNQLHLVCRETCSGTHLNLLLHTKIALLQACFEVSAWEIFEYERGINHLPSRSPKYQSSQLLVLSTPWWDFLCHQCLHPGMATEYKNIIFLIIHPRLILYQKSSTAKLRVIAWLESLPDAQITVN